MRISELIAKLQEAMAEHGDAHVVVDGYEGGYDDPCVAARAKMLHRNVENPDNSWWGQHDDPRDEEGERLAEKHVVVSRWSVKAT